MDDPSSVFVAALEAGGFVVGPKQQFECSGCNKPYDKNDKLFCERCILQRSVGYGPACWKTASSETVWEFWLPSMKLDVLAAQMILGFCRRFSRSAPLHFLDLDGPAFLSSDFEKIGKHDHLVVGEFGLSLCGCQQSREAAEIIDFCGRKEASGKNCMKLVEKLEEIFGPVKLEILPGKFFPHPVDGSVPGIQCKIIQLQDPHWTATCTGVSLSHSITLACLTLFAGYHEGNYLDPQVAKFLTSKHLELYPYRMDVEEKP